MPPKKQLKLCTICGQAEATQKKHKVCSAVLCLEEFNSRPRWSTRSCPQCGAEYQNDKWNPRQTCGVECRNKVRGSAREKVCPVCTTDFRADRPEQVYCSQGCFGKAHAGRGSRGGQTVTCPCGTPVEEAGRTRGSLYCCTEHRDRYGKRRPKSRVDTHSCQRCGNEFQRPWFYAGKKMFCSNLCQRQSQSNISVKEQEVMDFVLSLGVRGEHWWLPSGKGVDIYCPDQGVAFEFNGSWFHSEGALLDRTKGDKSAAIRYHLNKSQEAAAINIFLYHIFEYEWKDPRQRPIVESQIRNLLGVTTNRVYARKCTIELMSPAEAQRFLDENHMQGRASATYHYGLRCGPDLVAVMSFGPVRKQKQQSLIEWELVRFCVAQNTSVIGGADKLFKHFVRTHSPNSIVSYSEVAKTRGNLYPKLGFKFVNQTRPEYVNYHPNTGEVRRRYKTMKHKLLSEFSDILDHTMTERQMCEKLGFVRIHGCGNKVWVWRTDQSGPALV